MELADLVVDSYARLCAAGPTWEGVEALGLPGLLADHEGELDHPQRTALAIARLTGYHCVPLPVAETLVARALLRRAGLEAPVGRLALGRASAFPGEAVAPWAAASGHVVLAVGESVLLLETNKGQVEPAHNPAGEPRERIRFDDAACVARAALPGGAEWVALEAARYRAALMVGAAESALDMTVAYVADRVQFGKPLGKFQAVQQSLAVFAGEVSSALSACELAFARPEPDWRTVAVAKMRAGVAASVGCNAAHQAHGAIGVTAEYPLHLRTRRLWAWRAEDGSGTTWARRLGEAVIAEGPERLWPSLTAMR